MKRKVHQKYRGEGYCLVPGSCGGSWSDIEEVSFLLGLYIFGKNLNQVRRFIDTRTMGDILSHYYGKFYKSDEYRRWSDCRKMRSKRCAYGPRIFIGWRQQELLSRLCLHVPEACQNTILEVLLEVLLHTADGFFFLCLKSGSLSINDHRETHICSFTA